MRLTELCSNPLLEIGRCCRRCSASSSHTTACRCLVGPPTPASTRQRICRLCEWVHVRVGLRENNFGFMTRDCQTSLQIDGTSVLQGSAAKPLD